MALLCFFFFFKQVCWHESGELNKGESSSVNGTLLDCHSMWPFPFVLTSQSFALSKWPTSFVSESSLPVPPLFLFSFFVSAICNDCVTPRLLCHHWQRTHTHTGTKQGRAERKKVEIEETAKEELTSSFNCVSECPRRLHYPGIRRNLTCLLLETCKKCL